MNFVSIGISVNRLEETEDLWSELESLYKKYGHEEFNKRFNQAIDNCMDDAIIERARILANDLKKASITIFFGISKE